jgi:hypothetical protein
LTWLWRAELGGIWVRGCGVPNWVEFGYAVTVTLPLG